MTTSIFVNLPTTDLERSKAFFSGLDWDINPNFTDENAACVVIDENLYLMVLTREFFATFTDKPIADPHSSLQVETALSRDPREEVDAILQKALAGGGTEHREAQDYCFMYSRDPARRLPRVLCACSTATRPCSPDSREPSTSSRSR